MQTNLLHTFLLVLQYSVTGATIMGKQLQPCSVLGSFGVVLLSCVANFHVVRSALQNSMRLLCIFLLIRSSLDPRFYGIFRRWLWGGWQTLSWSPFFCNFWLSLFGFRTACFSGGEKRRSETRLRSQAKLQPWRNKTDCDRDYLTEGCWRKPGRVYPIC